MQQSQNRLINLCHGKHGLSVFLTASNNANREQGVTAKVKADLRSQINQITLKTPNK